jgi:hypothetical protein
MKSLKENYWLLVLGLISGALSFWINPYNEHILFGVDQRLILAFSTFLTALVFRLYFKKPTLLISTYIAGGVLIAFLLRVVFDTAFIDKSHHNLLPLSLIIYSLIIFPASFLGAFLAHLIKGKN